MHTCWNRTNYPISQFIWAGDVAPFVEGSLSMNKTLGLIPAPHKTGIGYAYLWFQPLRDGGRKTRCLRSSPGTYWGGGQLGLCETLQMNEWMNNIVLASNIFPVLGKAAIIDFRMKLERDKYGQTVVGRYLLVSQPLFSFGVLKHSKSNHKDNCGSRSLKNFLGLWCHFHP